MKKIVAALLCVCLLAALAACTSGGTTSASSEDTSSAAAATPTPGVAVPTPNTVASPTPSAVPTATPTAQPTATPTAQPTATPTEQPTAAPESGAEISASAPEQDDERLPAIDVDDPNFSAAFENNPLDAAYLEESELAASTTQMIELYNKYADAWQEKIDSLYQTLLGAAQGSAYDELREGQEAWVAATPAAIEGIKTGAAQDGSSAALTAAARVMEYYRDRAAALASIYYQMTGETGLD